MSAVETNNIFVPSLPAFIENPAKGKRVRKTGLHMEPKAISSSETEAVVHAQSETREHTGDGLSFTIDTIVYRWRQRQRWHRAEKSLVLQGKALCRSIVEGGDKDKASKLFDRAFEGKDDVDVATMAALAPFIDSIHHFITSRKAIEKELEKLAKKLPCWKIVENIHGIGPGGYASLIGEAGDLTKYRSVAALWKRMGVAVIGDTRQRKVAGAEEALVHGYSPGRRSVLWNIGNGLIGGMGRGKRPEVGASLDDYEWTDYQKLFVERCRYECAKNPEKLPQKEVDKDGVMLESYPKHVQSRAKRYVEKRFLREMYAAWRNEILGEVPKPWEG